jgi:hypothetical protein
MPQGALLFIEGKDFAGLLQDWSSSPEKKSWLKSDNYEVFSRSRLFLRLQAAQQEFAAAAGLPPDTKFLSDVAGQQTALGIYDIGKLEMLYITDLPSARASESALWQQRSKFEPRESAGDQFFARTDPQSGRSVAFAVDNGYLILGTREDLVAGALSAIKGAQIATVDREPWFTEAIKAAKEPGDLRMVMHLEEIARTPHFRTYWIQQNITATRDYRSAVSDLYRGSTEYHEQRVLLRKTAEPMNDSDNVAAQLAQFVPADAGYYSAASAPGAADVISTLEQILVPRTGPPPPLQTAPNTNLGDGTTGSETSLEERIDVPPTAPQTSVNGAQGLGDLIKTASPTAILKLARSNGTRDGVFVEPASTLVVSAIQNWDEAKVRSALEEVIAPTATASSLGTRWRTVGNGQQAHIEFDGLLAVAVAVRGKYLIASNDAGMLSTVLTNMQQKHPPVASASYIAGFQHEKQRQNFYRFASLVDMPDRVNQGPEREPEFFSNNLASLSKSLGQNLGSESIEIWRNGMLETQTVRYIWSH